MVYRLFFYIGTAIYLTAWRGRESLHVKSALQKLVLIVLTVWGQSFVLPNNIFLVVFILSVNSVNLILIWLAKQL